MTMIHNHRTITSQPYTNTMATVPEISSAAEDEQQQSSQWTGDVWIQDHWTEEDKAEARGRLAASSRFCRGGQDANDCELRQQQQAHAFQQFRRNASTNWNVFYHQNTTNFFKDRHYLQKSFPNEFGWLYDMTNVGDAIRCDPGGTENETSTAPAPPVDNSITKAEFRIVEVGCGVGNAILPLLEQHSKLMQQYTKELNMSSSDEIGTPSLRPCPPKFHIHCLDFAPNAIQLLKKDTRFQAAAMEGRATAHVYDLSSMHPSSIDIGIDHADFPTQLSDNTSTQTKTHQSLANSADVAILLFCLSAIGPHPSPALRRAAQNVIDMLRPGGTLVIRDYGRLDEAQMKLGNGDKELSDNFYRKGDGTGCYYFELNDLKDLFLAKDDDAVNYGKLELLELDYIQRVYRNRGDGTCRRRVWIQGRFRKPVLDRKNSGNSRDISHIVVDPLRDFLDSSVRRWDDYYRSLQEKTSSSFSLPTNLFQIFPNEFMPWISSQSSKRKEGRPQNQSGTMCGTPISSSHVTVIDFGCGLGNETLLNIIECQAECNEEVHCQDVAQEEWHLLPKTCSLSESSKAPILNVHFIDVSNEAIDRLRNDPRYKRAAKSNAENMSPANITCRLCNFASSQPMVDQSADIALLLFALSAIGPYQRHQHRSGNDIASGMIMAVQHAVNMLKDDGVILFQDYARYDDDQLQLNSVVGAQLCENFYVRCGEVDDDHNPTSTGTGCYFFNLEEVRELFTNAGLEELQLEYVTRVTKKSGKNGRDCNRNGGGASRTRRWVLGRFRKVLRHKKSA